MYINTKIFNFSAIPNIIILCYNRMEELNNLCVRIKCNKIYINNFYFVKSVEIIYVECDYLF